MHVHSEEKLTPEQEKVIDTAIQRARGHFLSVWLFCTKSACRRAGTCSFDPDFCMARVAPSVPQVVRDAVDGMIGARIEGKSFDEMLAQSQDRFLSYSKWLEAVAELQKKAKGGKGRTALKPPDLAAS